MATAAKHIDHGSDLEGSAVRALGVAPATLRDVVPAQLRLDTFDGRAWIGVTPFGVRNTRSRLIPPVSLLSAYPEINVRIYVTLGGRPGIYFFSLDADRALAVATGRRAYRLPYFRVNMSITRGVDDVHYCSTRTTPDAPPAAFRARYRPSGSTLNASPGSLEYWLTERYCLCTSTANSASCAAATSSTRPGRCSGRRRHRHQHDDGPDRRRSRSRAVAALCAPSGCRLLEPRLAP